MRNVNRGGGRDYDAELQRRRAYLKKKKKKFILTKNDLFKSFYCFPRLSIESEGLLNGLPFCYYY